MSLHLPENLNTLFDSFSDSVELRSLQQLAIASFDFREFTLLTQLLADSFKDFAKSYKAILLLEFLLHCGSSHILQWTLENVQMIKNSYLKNINASDELCNKMKQVLKDFWKVYYKSKGTVKSSVKFGLINLTFPDLKLLQASLLGYCSIVESAIQFGAFLDTKNQFGNTPLIIAAYNGHAEVCKVLLQAGSRLDISNELEQTALDVAIARNSTDVYLVLQNFKAGLDKINLHGSNIRDETKEQSNLVHTSSSIFLKACQKGNFNLCWTLFEKGVEVDCTDNEGNSALMLATLSGNFTLVEFLLNAGANTEVLNKRANLL